MKNLLGTLFFISLFTIYSCCKCKVGAEETNFLLFKGFTNSEIDSSYFIYEGSSEKKFFKLDKNPSDISRRATTDNSFNFCKSFTVTINDGSNYHFNCFELEEGGCCNNLYIKSFKINNKINTSNALLIEKQSFN